MDKCIAIIGATGNVGRLITQIILERHLVPANKLKLFASSNSTGKPLTVLEHTFIIHNTADYDFKDAMISLFATESDISSQYAPRAINAGSIVIDSSSHFRLDPAVPLILSPVNNSLISPASCRLYSTANCLASPTSIALAPLHKRFGVKRANVVTYQSVSGAGKQAMDELYQETKSILDKSTFKREIFKRQIAFNVIPQVGDVLETGYTQEEIKIIKEIQKIVSTDIQVTATAVRVPVMVGHSISLSLELNNDFTLDEVRQTLQQSPNIHLSENHYSTPVEVVGSDDVFVGRLKKDISIKNGLQLWLCSDNLRRGAATDAVEIVEILLKQL